MQTQMMKTAIFNVLSKMYFLVQDPEPENVLCSQDFSAWIEINGPGSYSLIGFHFSRRLALVMAANLLGTDEDEVSIEDLESTVLETCNMIAGNYLKSIDDNEKLRLGLPQKRLLPKQEETIRDLTPLEGIETYNAEPMCYEIFYAEREQQP